MKFSFDLDGGGFSFPRLSVDGERGLGAAVASGLRTFAKALGPLVRELPAALPELMQWVDGYMQPPEAPCECSDGEGGTDLGEPPKAPAAYVVDDAFVKARHVDTLGKAIFEALAAQGVELSEQQEQAVTVTLIANLP